MKKILLALSLIILTVAVFAQTAPRAAKANFAKNYPAATKVKWEKEEGRYEVSFVDKGKEMSAIYSEKGMLEETEITIPVSELPVAVAAYLQNHYKGIKVKDAARITKVDGSIMFEAAIKGKDILFDNKGNFIKTARD